MPPAARITDPHRCPSVPRGPLVAGASRVLIGHQRASRVGDDLTCAGSDKVAGGASNVLIEHRQAARLGDPTTRGGIITAGCPTVLIGTTPQGVTLATSAPFAEECEAARAERERRAGLRT